jgi:hypothetical protein
MIGIAFCWTDYSNSLAKLNAYCCNVLTCAIADMLALPESGRWQQFSRQTFIFQYKVAKPDIYASMLTFMQTHRSSWDYGPRGRSTF